MAITTRIEPIASFVEIVAREDLSPKAKSGAVAAFAREQLLAAQESNKRVLGRTPGHKTFVDGRQGAALETVRPVNGTIVFEFEMVADLVRAIAAMLVERSPIRHGGYLRGHRIFADGVEVRSTAGGVPAAIEYTFLNIVPYARKVEIGKTKAGRAFLIQVPNRIYERTARDASRRFGNIAKITFSYRAPVGGGIVKYRAGSAASRRGGAERSARTPAIIVTLR